MPIINVTRTYLEMTSRGQLRPARLANAGLVLDEATSCTPALFRHLYGTVGAQYHWVDRKHWTDEQIQAYLAKPGISIWILREGGREAGYFELAREADGSIEIVYFGLFPDYVGRGFGKHMLTLAVEQAWALGARRVWLHTCTLDHEAALPNYLKRGFTQFRTDVYQTDRP